jgi:hypothetical protein
MNTWILWLIFSAWILVPLFTSGVSLWKLFLGWRIPVTWISALPGEGWAEVTGKVRGNLIKSLLSQTSCAYWQLEVKEYQSGGKGSGRWRTVHKSSSGEIEVDDMTGRIKILDQNSDLVVNNETVRENLDEATKTTLNKLGIKTKGFLGFNKKMRVYERLIAPDEEIFVLGKLAKSEGAISMSAGAIVPLIISNFSKPEMMKAMFWSTVRPLIFPFLFGLVLLGFFIYSTFR